MKQTITLKGFTPTTAFENRIKSGIAKLERRFIHFQVDLPALSIFLKKHEKHTFFSAQFTLKLPKKSLQVNCTGHHEEELLHDGFEKLLAEFEKYKGKNFASNSTYFNHASIRKDSKS